MSYPYPARADIGRTLLPEPVAPVEPERCDPDDQPEMDALVDALDRQHADAPECGPIEYGACDCCSEMVPLDELSDLIVYGIETTACDGCRGIES